MISPEELRCPDCRGEEEGIRILYSDPKQSGLNHTDIAQCETCYRRDELDQFLPENG